MALLIIGWVLVIIGVAIAIERKLQVWNAGAAEREKKAAENKSYNQQAEFFGHAIDDIQRMKKGDVPMYVSRSETVTTYTRIIGPEKPAQTEAQTNTNPTPAPAQPEMSLDVLDSKPSNTNTDTTSNTNTTLAAAAEAKAAEPSTATATTPASASASASASGAASGSHTDKDKDKGKDKDKDKDAKTRTHVHTGATAHKGQKAACPDCPMDTDGCAHTCGWYEVACVRDKAKLELD